MTAGAQDDCLFCKIVAGAIPAEVVLETGQSLAFRDVNPQAPTHVLVIPKVHRPNVAALGRHEPEALADLMETVAAVSESEGLEGHYRLVFNTGEKVGQSVFHVHGHVLGGRSMGWPPG
jgi:histidine triad (HIT) family protein